MSNIGSGIRGIYRDVLTNGNGMVVHDSDWKCNAIVDRCRMLLAGFMKNDASQGIRFLAVGSGQETWDVSGAPAPGGAVTHLEHPYNPSIPVGNLELAYLDDHDNEVNSVTNRLQVTATLGPGYPAPLAPLSTYPLREFGLFGRFGATDYMIDVIRHPVIHKDAAATLVRVVRLYF
jgi:hypothetical protein